MTFESIFGSFLLTSASILIYTAIMKTRETAYQRVLLDGKWYIIIEEDEFLSLTQPQKSRSDSDLLDAFNVSDQRLANRLIERRQLAGLTQKDLAQRANIRVETLNRIEKGHTTPDFRTIRKLVNAITHCTATRQEVPHDNTSHQQLNK